MHYTIDHESFPSLDGSGDFLERAGDTGWRYWLDHHGDDGDFHESGSVTNHHDCS